MITWVLGDQELDSGFRSDRAAEHSAWVAALTDLTSKNIKITETEGAR